MNREELLKNQLEEKTYLYNKLSIESKNIIKGLQLEIEKEKEKNKQLYIEMTNKDFKISKALEYIRNKYIKTAGDMKIIEDILGDTDE